MKSLAYKKIEMLKEKKIIDLDAIENSLTILYFVSILKQFS
jgi:hypothetical protein